MDAACVGVMTSVYCETSPSGAVYSGVSCDTIEDSLGNVYTRTVDGSPEVRVYYVASLGDTRMKDDIDGIKVCDEGGDIQKGDFLCTASGYPGHFKKQSDNIHRNYTIAKAMEPVTFSGSTTASGIYAFLMN